MDESLERGEKQEEESGYKIWIHLICEKERGELFGLHSLKIRKTFPALNSFTLFFSSLSSSHLKKLQKVYESGEETHKRLRLSDPEIVSILLSKMRGKTGRIR